MAIILEREQAKKHKCLIIVSKGGRAIGTRYSNTNLVRYSLVTLFIALTMMMAVFILGVKNNTPAKAATERPITLVSMQQNVSLLPGEKRTVTINTAPADTTSTIEVTWDAGNSKAFAITRYRRSVDIRGVSHGSGTITVTVKEKNSAGQHIKTYRGKITVNVTQRVPIQSVALNRTAVTINKGEYAQLSTVITPVSTTDSKTVTWTSSNPAVASVKSTGKIFGKAPGSTIITAKVGNKTATCRVTVKAPITKLYFNKSDVTLNVGQSQGLITYFAPLNTTDSKTIAWATSNAKVATIKQGNIKAVGAGTAVITAKMGKMTASCKVTVKYVAPKFNDVSECYNTLNTYRKNAWLGTLRRDATLENLAKQRAKDLVASYSHTRPDGTRGISMIPGNVYKGENLAKGYKNCRTVMEAWWNSDGHRALMLGWHYTKVGIACYEYNSVCYWVIFVSS